MPHIKIRRYRRRDRAAVLRITRESFGGYCLDENIEAAFGRLADTSWQDRKAAGVDSDLTRNPEHCLVAVHDADVVGYVCTRLYRYTATGHIANLAVSPEHQGRGIGRALLEASLRHFRKCGMRHARIETLEQNERGLHLYPVLGFREVGRQVFYFREL